MPLLTLPTLVAVPAAALLFHSSLTAIAQAIVVMHLGTSDWDSPSAWRPRRRLPIGGGLSFRKQRVEPPLAAKP